MSIILHNEIIDKYIPAESKDIEAIIKFILKKEYKKLKSLNLYIIDDQEMLKINKKIKKANEFTDTISINLEVGDVIDGEIFISLDRIEENSKIFHTTLKSEFMRIVVHSVLHLCGYRDDSEQLKMEMQKKEDFILGLFVSRETDIC